jgi:hypothetical protein
MYAWPAPTAEPFDCTELVRWSWAEMYKLHIKVMCETEGCTQNGAVKSTVRGEPAGPGLVRVAPIICLGCGCEPRVLEESA